MKLGSLVLGLFVSSIVVSAVACGDSDADKAKAAAQKSEAEEQETFLSTYCAIVLPCCNKILSKDLNDVAGCKAHLRDIDPLMIANKEARDACTAQAKAAFPDPNFCKDFAQANTPACPDPSRKVLTGVKKVGDTCANASECAPDFTGIVDCQGGICQLRKRGAEGEGPCDTTIDGDVTLAALDKDQSATVYTCYRGLKEGSLQCDLSSKTCITAYEDRAKCTADTQCDKAQYCNFDEDDEDENRCFNKKPLNSKCHQDAECLGHCKLEEDVEKGGFCVDPVDEDADCDTTQWCKSGLECISGKCTPPGPDKRLADTCTP